MGTRRGARAIGVGLGLLALGGCGETKAPAERSAEAPPVPVRVATARPEPVPLEAEAVGTVRARTTTVIASNVRGYVVEVRVREGMRVAAGDLLIRLAGEDAAAQLAHAEASAQAAGHARDEATQALAEARAGEAEAQGALEAARRAIDEAAAGTAAAEAQAALAQTTLARYRQMFEERALSRQEYDEVVARERTVRAELDRARAALGQRQSRLAQAESALQAAGMRVQGLQSRIQGAEARIREAEAEVRRARVQLAYTQITAPGPALVVEKLVEVGELAPPGKPLLRLDDPSGYRLEAQLPSGHADRARVGQPAAVRVDDLGERVLQGRVTEIIPTADPTTRTVTVKIDLPATEGLRSGLYGKARFVIGQVESLRVPVAAVVERGQLTGVFVVDAERVARLRLVTLGRRDDRRVEILSGLSPGERVVVEGVERVADGRRVDAKE